MSQTTVDPTITRPRQAADLPLPHRQVVNRSPHPTPAASTASPGPDRVIPGGAVVDLTSAAIVGPAAPAPAPEGDDIAAARSLRATRAARRTWR